MNIIRPVIYTDAMLISSSVPETDATAWSSVTTYAEGATCIKNHRVYESVQSGNLNHDPAADNVAWWLDTGPTNRWGMLDSQVNTLTTANESIVVTLTPGRVDSIAVLLVSASSVTVRQTLGAEVIYERTVSLIDAGVLTDWRQYFFEPINSKTDALFSGLSLIGESQITVTISRPGGAVSCGMLVMGMEAEIGRTLISPRVGIVDFSRKETDSFGNPLLVKRAYSKRMTCQLIIENKEVDRVTALLAEYRATPLVWIGAGDRYSCMLMLGFYRDFEVNIAYSSVSYCDLSVEGMI